VSEASDSLGNRRPPVLPGNEIALRHGAYSLVRLRPRAEPRARVRSSPSAAREVGVQPSRSSSLAAVFNIVPK